MVDVVEFRSPDASGFVMTPTAEAIVNLAAYCQQYGEMGFVVGDPGTGKSSALSYYAESHDHVYSVSLRHEHSRGMAPMLFRLCEGVGMPAYGRDHLIDRANRVHDWLVRLWDGLDGHEPLIILDEAQYLDDRVLDFLRCCWDDARVGIVFAGNNLLRRGFLRAQATTLAAFSSRLGPRLDLGAPTAADVAAICRARGVQGAREVAFLQRYVKAGGLRAIDSVLTTAARRFPGEATRLPQLQSACIFLGL